MPHIAYIPKVTPSGRGMTVMLAPTPKRPSALLTSAVEGGFWGGRSPSQKATGTARRQARRARQEPDAQRFEREIGVFPAQTHTATKHICPYNLDADYGESVGFMECSDSGTE